MFLFFPYSTDAPIYYWPFTTVAMIVVNLLVFVLDVANPDFKLKEALSLQTGNGLHPAQWLTNNFAHDGFFHVAGNMVFLWAFGLIVEGKLGWWKTLLIYVGLGVVQGVIEQTLMLCGPETHVLGASSIVFGFMAMSLIWAPENSLQCVLVILFPIVKWFDISIKVFVGIFLALQVVGLLFSGFSMSTALLHVLGAALGFAVGIWMVKTKRVDCENWDIFSILAGRHRMSEQERNEELFNSPEFRQRQELRANQRAAEALQWIHDQVREGNAKAAVEVYRRVQSEVPGWTLPDAGLFDLVVAVRKAGLNGDAMPLMAEYLAHYATHAASIRIALGESLVRQQRPAQALKVLGKLDDAALDPRRRQAVHDLREQARALHAADPYEVADDDW